MGQRASDMMKPPRRWPTHFITSALEDHRFEVNMKNLCSRGLVLTTDYSGIGTGELAARSCQEAMKLKKVCAEDFVTCQRSCDIEAHCRKALLLLGEDTCVFGDMLQRMPAPALKKLKASMSRASTRVKKLVENGSAQCEAALQVGKPFLTRAVGIRSGSSSACSTSTNISTSRQQNAASKSSI